MNVPYFHFSLPWADIEDLLSVLQCEYVSYELKTIRW